MCNGTASAVRLRRRLPAGYMRCTFTAGRFTQSAAMKRVAATVTTTLLFAGAMLAACGPPRTDIVATNIEHVGNFDLKNTTVADDGLRGAVCVADASDTDEIVGRVLQQLANHAYKNITLDVYAADRAIGRYVWTPNAETRAAIPQPASPCGATQLTQR